MNQSRKLGFTSFLLSSSPAGRHAESSCSPPTILPSYRWIISIALIVSAKERARPILFQPWNVVKCSTTVLATAALKQVNVPKWRDWYPLIWLLLGGGGANGTSGLGNRRTYTQLKKRIDRFRSNVSIVQQLEENEKTNETFFYFFVCIVSFLFFWYFFLLFWVLFHLSAYKGQKTQHLKKKTKKERASFFFTFFFCFKLLFLKQKKKLKGNMLPLYSRALMTKVFPRTLPSGQETPCHLSFFLPFFSFYLKKNSLFSFLYESLTADIFLFSFPTVFFFCVKFFSLFYRHVRFKKKEGFFSLQNPRIVSPHTHNSRRNSLLVVAQQQFV